MSTPEIIPWPEIEPEQRGKSFRQQITEWNEVTGAMNGYYNNECCYFADDADKMIAALSGRLRMVVDELSEALAAGEDMEWVDLRNRMAYIRMMIDINALASIGELKGEI